MPYTFGFKSSKVTVGFSALLITVGIILLSEATAVGIWLVEIATASVSEFEARSRHNGTVFAFK